NRIQLNGTFENVIGTQFDDVINGNSADNVLVGLAGDDTLRGQQGRDVLIGGLGSDRLVANADEDILIGGFTSFDNNLAALLAIQAEWSRTDLAYQGRVDHILGTTSGGLNAPFFLNASTVFDDGQADTLTGSQQQDLFFIDAFDT